jgi:hypothetical protein
LNRKRIAAAALALIASSYLWANDYSIIGTWFFQNLTEVDHNFRPMIEPETRGISLITFEDSGFALICWEDDPPIRATYLYVGDKVILQAPGQYEKWIFLAGEGPGEMRFSYFHNERLFSPADVYLIAGRMVRVEP